MIPRIIHFIHLGDPPSEQVWANIELAARLNPRWSRLLWTNETLESFGGGFMELLAAMPNYATQSSLARLFILNRFGGVYLDTDCECLKPLDALPIDGAFAAEQDGGRICNAVIGATPEHPWITWQIKHIWDFDVRDGAAWIYLMTAAPRGGLTLVPQHWVYPFMYDSPPEQRVAHPDSLLVHHWASSWTKSA